MHISPTLVALLAALTQSLDEPCDLESNVRALARRVATAVASYLGLTMAVVADGYELSFTIREDIDSMPEIGNSLRIPLDDLSGGESGSSLVLYAATPGAFVDLAADLSFALGLGPGVLVLDAHLHAPLPGFDPAGLAAHSTINQAVGVFIDRGHTVESARDELRRRAAHGSIDLVAAANQVLLATPRQPRTDYEER